MYLELGLIFLVSLIYIKIMVHYAPKLGLVDIPNERSSHSKHTPRGAGIGFFLAVATVAPFFHWTLIENWSWVILAISMVFIIGVLDDHNDVSPRAKLIVMVVSTLLIYQSRLVIDDIGTFFGFDIYLGWLALPFTLFAVVAFSNALNLIDGLDGLAGGISMVILGTFFAIGYQYHDEFIMVLSGGFFVALAAFMLFNWHPASIFMGDSGSLMLGFVITTVAIRSLDYIPAVSVLFIAALPIIDTAVVVMRRKRTGRGIFSADKCHLHHILHEFFGGNTRKTVIFLIVMQAVYSLTGLQFTKNNDEGILLVLFLLNIIIVYFYSAAMIRRQNRTCGKPKESENS
ncbi:MAG: MraY family glycosyltransferase [Campylobacterota bacterium]|nr:MraY family glycosyltransferase [Campylobacterota bacterium]